MSDETMILVKAARNGDLSPRTTYWAEQPKGTGINALTANVEKAMETEDLNSPAREVEVLEVKVIRRLKVQRQITREVKVNIDRSEAA